MNPHDNIHPAPADSTTLDETTFVTQSLTKVADIINNRMIDHQMNGYDLNAFCIGQDAIASLLEANEKCIKLLSLKQN